MLTVFGPRQRYCDGLSRRSFLQLGTALLCTAEAGTSQPYRRALLERRYAQTIITRAFMSIICSGPTRSFESACAAAGARSDR